MRQLAAVLLFAVAAGCDGSDIDNGIADRADPATGPDGAERAPILTVSPAEFAPGETIAAGAAGRRP